MQLTTPTLQMLLTDVRLMLNVKDPSNSFWSMDELTSYINEGVRVYFAECVLANEGYFTVKSGGSIPDLNIVSGVETVSLPSDCFQVKNLWIQINDGWSLLPYRNNLTEGYSTQGGSSLLGYYPYYDFQGNNITLYPTPNFSATGALRIEYIQFPDQMIWGGDQLTSQVSPVFKQVLTMYAVYKAKLKESLVNGVSMHTVAEENLNNLYLLFKNTIAKRSRNPQYVVSFSPETDGI